MTGALEADGISFAYPAALFRNSMPAEILHNVSVRLCSSKGLNHRCDLISFTGLPGCQKHKHASAL